MRSQPRLSEKSIKVFGLIADGQSSSQIIDNHTDIGDIDIVIAAKEALRLNQTPSDYHVRMKQIKVDYPKAYEQWTPTDDVELATLFSRGEQLKELARRFQRKPSAIRSRLAKLNGFAANRFDLAHVSACLFLRRSSTG